MFNFERLDVWQESVAYAGQIYAATRSFPADERFGPTSQIRRAATSVASNIAERSARPPADFAKFVGHATGSLYETITQAVIARNEGFLSAEAFTSIHASAEEIARMLSGLRKSLGE
ncbi:MAG TPA: four helix bundle protein [Opitutus sp.]|nr:four helix bundle protein [Opitutus sp.]